MIRLTALLVILFTSHTAYATISSAKLQTLVKNWVMAELQIAPDEPDTDVLVKRLDSRIVLDDCENISYEMMNQNINASRFTVKATCLDKSNWKAHIPVHIVRTMEVVTLQSPIRRGMTIQEQDVILTPQNVNNLTQGYFKDKSEVIGKVAKRSLKAGVALTPRYITPPIILERGDRVNIIAETLGLVVKSHGVVQMDGKEGERINVKNLSSNKTIQAVVVDSNTVKVEL